MSRRVLVLENDRKFAAELKKAFESQGLEVDVFSDGQHGIDHALEERPDLIVVAVELPKENGYLICKKIKKNAFLSSIPIVILSSSSDADHLFSEHRKLRTQRADLYVKKPIKAAKLLRELTEVLPLNVQESDAEEVDDEVSVVDEDVFEDEATQTGARLEDIAAHLQHGHPPVDAEMDSFAENAFSSIVMEDSVKKEPPPLVRNEDVSGDIDDFIEDQLAQSSPRRSSSIPSYQAASSDDGDLYPDSEGSIPSYTNGSSSAVMPTDSQEVRALQSEVSDLRQQIADLTQRASKADKLESELREHKGRPSKPAIGISSREYLDLREALNGKDKELLGLRDQLSSRDKQMLELRDSNLQLERLGADFQDRIAELEDNVQVANDRIQSLTADKDAANKRAEDFKSRFERAESKAKKLEQDLEVERQTRVKELQRVNQEKDEALAQAAVEHQDERTRLTHQHAGEISRLRDEHSQYVSALQSDFESKTNALVQEHDELLSKTREDARVALEDLRGEHATQVARMQAKFEEEKEHLNGEAQASKARALDELRGELTGQMQRALREAEEQRQNELNQARAEAADELERTKTDLHGRHEAELASVRAKHDNELAVLGRKLSETEQKLSETQSELEQSKKHGSDLSHRLRTTSEERDRLSNELAVTQSNVEELEQTKQEHVSRIDILVGAQRDLESELTRAQEKINKDTEILERARKAFTIGFMLLEEQQNNAVQSS